MKKITALLFAAVLVFSLSSCAKPGKKSAPAEIPGDFSFYLEWDCNGDSTYDSKTGKLVKQKIATKVEDYTTAFFLSDEQKAEIFALISDMKPENYPDSYNPLDGMSAPSRNIILSVTYNGKTKTISCMNVTLLNKPADGKGEKFMAVHDRIVGILTSSAEWKALPDYEFYYD